MCVLLQASPCEKDVQETLCSLRFASRVQSVELGKAVKKVDRSASVKQVESLKVHDGNVRSPSGLLC